MGIYEHRGGGRSNVQLRELITGNEFHCHVASGYAGKQGELWYVRLVPALSSLSEAGDHHVVLTTPYS